MNDGGRRGGKNDKGRKRGGIMGREGIMGRGRRMMELG